jgi:type III pantothenate kinase
MLLVDIGNTRTKYIQHNRLGIDSPSVMLNTELCELWLEENWQYDFSHSIETTLLKNKVIYLVCVAQPAVVLLIQQWCDNHNIKLHQISSEKSRFGLTSFYQIPKQLGADRWLALLGAKSLYPEKNLIVVDAGTATTIDCLQYNGQHKGGWILPGIDMMFNSLLVDTADVKAEQKVEAQLTFGASSSENVNHATWAATLGMIDQSIKQALNIGCKPDLVIVIGGKGKQLYALMKSSEDNDGKKNKQAKVIYTENLIFYGLKNYETVA